MIIAINHIDKIQSKLKVDQPNDRYEQEADAVADQVIKSPSSQIERIQRKRDDSEQEQLQMKSFQDDIAPIAQKQHAESDLVQMQGRQHQANSSSNSSMPIVDRIDVFDSSGGFSGFPTVHGVDLNKPGKFNETSGQGRVMNVHQIAFHLSQGSHNDVKLVRCVDRVARAGGQAYHKTSLDGPSIPSVIGTGNSIVVADNPGYRGTKNADKDAAFPVSYIAKFKLYAYDIVTKKILASVNYVVVILKNELGENSPVNRIGAINKKIGSSKLDSKMCIKTAK